MVVLSRVLDWELSTPTTASYTDVATSSWCYSAVETALELGVITLQETAFRPSDALTREEMAVMLVRALGYTTLSGLAQDLSLPFIDVHTNRGYIAMAYEMDLMTGTSTTTFAPDEYTTRGQVAVILMRLYDKLALGQETYAIVTDLSDTTALQSQSVIALPSATLSSGTSARINPQVSAADQQAAIDVIHENGGTALLYLTGSDGAMRGVVSDTVDVITAYIDTIGYDGVFLDISKLDTKYRTFLLQLAQELDAALGDMPLYLMVEAPSWNGTTYSGYDYANLSNSVDRLVLRVSSYSDSSDTFLIAPMDPIEEVYYALTHLPSGVDSTKLALLLTTTGTMRTGTSGSSSVTASVIQTYLSDSDTQVRTSDRYSCQYLMAQVEGTYLMEDVVVWYLDGQAVTARLQLCDLLDVGSIVISNGESMLPSVSEALA